MKNNISELVFVLDRSGSMSGLESDTVGGVNSVIKKQREVEGKCFVTTVLFNHTSETVHDRVELEEVRPMTEKDFVVGGSTALLDALGNTIKHIKNIHRYARPEDVPEHTIFVIMTDGMENASHRFGSDEIKAMIEHQKEASGWEFLFLAANIDAVQTAARMGIGADRSVNYNADRVGTRVAYEAVAETVCLPRMGSKIGENWNRRITEDNIRRGKNK